MLLYLYLSWIGSPIRTRERVLHLSDWLLPSEPGVGVTVTVVTGDARAGLLDRTEVRVSTLATLRPGTSHGWDLTRTLSLAVALPLA